jgi:integrase
VDLVADYGLSARITLYRTKSGKPRGVPLNRAAYDALRTVEADDVRRVGRVFKKRDARAWGQIRSGFAMALERDSHFVMRGGSLRALQEILGHADYKMMRYAHLSPVTSAGRH